MLFRSPLFPGPNCSAPAKLQFPVPKSETCGNSDSNILNLIATLRDSNKHERAIWNLVQTPSGSLLWFEFSLTTLVKGDFSMFAVIVDGNRQHRVQEGSFLSVDYRNEIEAGASITFDQVLLANGGGASVIGTPTISGASVVAEVIIAQEKGLKLEIQKLRKRKNSRRHTGHRQKHTRVQIKTITIPGIQIVEEKAAE